MHQIFSIDIHITGTTPKVDSHMISEDGGMTETCSGKEIKQNHWKKFVTAAIPCL
jgi:hypothetical protein